MSDRTNCECSLSNVEVVEAMEATDVMQVVGVAVTMAKSLSVDSVGGSEASLLQRFAFVADAILTRRFRQCYIVFVLVELLCCRDVYSVRSLGTQLTTPCTVEMTPCSVQLG